MPWVAFYANFLWVMVLGLVGPSVPAIVNDLGITYSRAGFLFTALSLGSLFGTLFGGVISDRVNRKVLFSLCALTLAAGLVFFGRSQGYVLLFIFMFLMSLGGSPVGVIGQTIMLDMFPGKRETYLSFQAFFAALGNFIAPLIVAMNVGLGLSWRWSFFDASILAVVLCFLAVCVGYPSHVEKSHARIPVKKILSHRKVIIAALFILFSVAVDIGFSYWLAEYFAGSLGVQLKIASAVVSIYLAGIITGRLSTPFFLKFAPPLLILQIGLSFSLLVLVFFLFVPSIVFKAVSVFFYGLGVGPLFPLMLAKGTEDYSGQSGSVSGILFSFMSVGGMTFPFLFGAIAQLYSIRTTYFVLLLIIICLIVSISIWKSRLSSSRES